MILQALVSYYEALSKAGKIAQPGWSPVKVSYALELNDEGAVTGVFSLKNADGDGKKMRPRELSLPTPGKRTSGIKPNFLGHNSSYLLGVDAKGKPQRSAECFRAAAEMHRRLLGECEEPAAKALLRFFDTWSAERFEELVPEEEQRKEILAGANLVFLYDSQFLHENERIREAWQAYYFASDGEKYPCLVTGRIEVPAMLHRNIMGIPGTQSSGAALVSFNAPAYCSYKHKQGLNAPTSQYAAFAYGEALNYLVREQRTRIGDTTVLFWAESAEEAYNDIMSFCWTGDDPETYREQELQAVVAALCKGDAVVFDETLLDPNMTFYILGLAPNAARLSVRFFLRNSFGGFLRNMQEHQERLKIIHSEKFETIPLRILLRETLRKTVNQNSRDKTPAPNMAGETLRAILTNAPYPATLLNGVELRIRADREMNRTRAAIIKAYYLKKPHPDISKEVLQVSLNPECNDTAYVLGRLFYVLEEIQLKASNYEIKTTIRDKYFSSASTTPVVAFPSLIRLAQKHLKKIGGGSATVRDKQMTELIGRLDQKYPTHLSLPQQGAFQLGYYHQKMLGKNKEEK